MTAGVMAQFGVANETAYATPVAVSRFFEFNSEGIAVQRGTIESRGMRATRRFVRADRRIPYILGASGNVTMDVMSRGFGFWLQHILGGIASGSVVDSATTHTGTIGNLIGRSFSAQVGMPYTGSTAASAPKSMAGGKIAQTTFACEQGGILTASMDMDFATIDHSTALAAPSYPTGVVEPLTFVRGTVSIGGTMTDVQSAQVVIASTMNTDRRYLRASTVKKEPVDSERSVTFTTTLDWENLTHQNRVLSATAAGATAAVVLDFEGLQLIGTTSRPKLTITIPAVMFDGDTPTVGGPEEIPQSLTGVALEPSSGSPITIAYTTGEATP